MGDFWPVFWLTLLGVTVVGPVVYFFVSRWPRMRCKHKRYFENPKCEAIFIDCVKNLGFIGNLRRKEHE